MKKFIKWLLILTAFLVTGIVVLIYNPGLVKTPLERYLSNASGYDISLEGGLDIDPGKLTGLTVSQLRITAPAWSSQRDLVSVGKLSLVLDSASLFRDIMVIESLQMDSVQVNLETDSTGFGNWIVSAYEPSEERSGSDPAVVFNNIQISNTDLRYRNGIKETEQILHIASLQQEQQPDGMLNLSLEGDFNRSPVVFEGSAGPFKNLLQGREVVFSGSGNFGSLEISAKGLIDDLLKPRRPQFNLEIQGPDIDEVTAMFGIDDLGGGIFSFKAQGEEVNGAYEAGINGEIGDLALHVTARSSGITELDELDLTLAANGPRLGAVMRAVGVEGWPDEPFSIKADIERTGGTFNISPLTLSIAGSRLELDALLSNFPNLDSSRVRLSVSGDDAAMFRDLLGIRGVATGPFDIRGKLDVTAEEVELIELNAKSSLGNLVVSGTLGPGPSYAGSKLRLHIDGPNAHTLMSVINIDAMPEDAFNLDAQIESIENGLVFERSVLVTDKGERLELEGFLSLEQGSQGTELGVKLDGQHLSQLLQKLIPGMEIPDIPYSLSGLIRVEEEAIRLENIQSRFSDIELELSGVVNLQDDLVGSSFDLEMGGDDFSSLRSIPVLAKSMDIFVPGQSYRATGQFGIESNGWKIDNVSGRIGDTSITLDALISNHAEWAGSNLSFSVNGPDVHQFLVDPNKADLPLGTFETSGLVALSSDSLRIKDFRFDAEKAQAKIDMELGRPLRGITDIDFNVHLSGDDIRNLLPRTDFFEPQEAAFNIQTVGHKQGDKVSLKHFDADIGELKIALEGNLDTDSTGETVNITFDARSNDLSTFALLYGNRMPAMPLDLKADFKGNARQFAVGNLAGTLGESNIAGTLDVSLTGDKPVMALDLRSTLIDMRPFLKPAEAESEETTESEEPTDIEKDRLIPATPLPLESLDKADITFNLSVDEVRHRNDIFQNLALEAEISSGSLEVSNLSLEGRQGNLRSSLSMNPISANIADVKIDLVADKIIFNFYGIPDEKLSELPAYDIDFHAGGTGGNWQEVAASLNGELTTASEGGKVEGLSLGILDTFILDQVIESVMPKSDELEYLEIVCHASALNIEDGLVKTDPAIAYTTDKLMVVANGTLDLKTEKLNINFNATPTNVLKISASEMFNPLILIGGTLADPDVGLDPGKTILHGGVAIGTAGISIVAKGLVDRLGAAKRLCKKMLEENRHKQQ